MGESEAKLKALIENSSDIITIIDRDGFIRYGSPSAQKIFKIKPGTLIGKNIFELIHEEDRLKMREVFQKILESREAVLTPEFKARAPDGRIIYFEAVGKNMLDDPAIKGIVANVRDITDRKLREESQRKLRELPRIILEKYQCGIALINSRGEIEFSNTALQEITGYSKEELNMLKVNRILPDSELIKKFILESMSDAAEIKDLKTHLTSKNGRKTPVSISLSAITLDERKTMLVVENLQMKNKVSKYLHKFVKLLLNQIKISLFQFDYNGPTPLISEEISPTPRENTDILVKMSVYYFSTIGQGRSWNTGLYGPLPVPDRKDLIALVYSFKKQNFMGEKLLCLITLTFTRTLEKSFIMDRGRLEKIFSEKLEKIKDIAEIDLLFLRKLKIEILNELVNVKSY